MSFSRAEPRLDAQAGRDLEALEGVAVAGIGHRDGERAVAELERQDLRVPQELDVQPGERAPASAGNSLRADQRDAEVLATERQQVVLGDEAEVEQQALDALAALLLQPPDLAEVVGADPAALEEQVFERLPLDGLRFHHRLPNIAI